MISENPKESLESLRDDLILAADQYLAFAQVWDELDGEQRKAVKVLMDRANKLLYELVTSREWYSIPEAELKLNKIKKYQLDDLD